MVDTTKEVDDPFADPSSDFESICDAKYVTGKHGEPGELVLVTPTAYHADMRTVHGQTDCVDADAVILTGEDSGKILEGIRVFARFLVPVLKKRVKGGVTGQTMTLARMSTKPNEKNKKGDPCWIFLPPSDEDKVIARDYLASVPPPSDPFGE